MKIIGVDDIFGQSGSAEELTEHYGLGADSIVQATKDLLAK